MILPNSNLRAAQLRVIKCVLSGPKVSLAREYALKKHKIQEWAWDDLPKNVKYQAERIFNIALMLNWNIITAYKYFNTLAL